MSNWRLLKTKSIFSSHYSTCLNLIVHDTIQCTPVDNKIKKIYTRLKFRERFSIAMIREVMKQVMKS